MNKYDLAAINNALQYLHENIKFTYDKSFLSALHEAELKVNDENILLGLKLLKKRFSKFENNP